MIIIEFYKSNEDKIIIYLFILFYLFIEQEVTNSVNYDEVIEEFKMLIDGQRRLVL